MKNYVEKVMEEGRQEERCQSKDGISGIEDNVHIDPEILYAVVILLHVTTNKK
jgi:hypothetical protein